MICHHTTKAVVHIFNEQGFSADVYLDDFYGAEYQSLAIQAFSQLGQLFQQLGLDSSPEKDKKALVHVFPWTVTTVLTGELLEAELPGDAPLDSVYGLEPCINAPRV